MPFRAAAVLGALLVPFALSTVDGAPRVCRAALADAAPARPDAHPTSPRPAPAPADRARPGAEASGSTVRGRPSPDPDQDLIDHLDVVENLELLQNLELFDTGAPGGK